MIVLFILSLTVLAFYILLLHGSYSLVFVLGFRHFMALVMTCSMVEPKANLHDLDNKGFRIRISAYWY